MPDLCCQYDYAGIQINDETDGTDRLVLLADGATGLDGGPLRRQVDPKGHSVEGGIVHDARFGARLIAFRGFVDIRTVPVDSTVAYFAAVNVLEAAVIAALEAQRNSNATLSWTPHGMTAHSISAKYGVPGGEIRFTGSMIIPQWTFTLVAADPAISVA